MANIINQQQQLQPSYKALPNETNHLPLQKRGEGGKSKDHLITIITTTTITINIAVTYYNW